MLYNVKYENHIEGIKSVYSSNINKLLEYYSHRINHREIICYIILYLYYITYIMLHFSNKAIQ